MDNTLQLQMCESRTSTGIVSSQYFSLGVDSSSTKYFFTTDQLGLTMSTFSPLGDPRTAQGGVIYPIAHAGSVREVCNSSGSISEQIAYDPFGKTTVIAGSNLPDFQYANYYYHQPSKLNLTRQRAYSPTLGRFLSRDPIFESGGNNLFAYAGNQPINFSDPSGLDLKKGGVGTSDPRNVNGSGTDTGTDPHVYIPPPCPCVPPNGLVTREAGGGPDGVNNWKAPNGTIYDPKGRPICGTGPAPPTPPPPQPSGTAS